MAKLTLKLLDGTFAIHSLPVDSPVPAQALQAPIYFIAKTYEEVSLVLPEHISIASDDVERDWQVLEVVGPLDFTLTGILASISTVLANEKISIFAISTFDTDYILVKRNNVLAAIRALENNDYRVLQ